MPPQYCDLDSFQVTYGDPNNYDVFQKIGHGGFSTVFSGQDIRTGQLVVIKTLKKEKEDDVKTKMEIRALQLLKGGPNIIELVDVVQYPIPDATNQTMAFVMEYINQRNKTWQ